jgi:outer membrane protein assembly factor BamE (lipoprotein component of BamABCDE complex)
MKLNSIHSGLRVGVCAALLFGVAAVQAATGFTVTLAQEKLITVGMSRDMVRSTLGRPAHNVKFRAEPGRTWTYGVVGTADKVFDIDFAADGKVVSVSERVENIE